MIYRSNLTTIVQYKGANIDGNFMLIGFVDIRHSTVDADNNPVENLVFHQLLTYRTMEQVEGLTAEEIQQLAQDEANEILAGEEANKKQDDYITLVNLGLY